MTCHLVAGGMDLAERLLQDQKMCQSKQACAGLSDIKLLFSYLQLFQVTDKVLPRFLWFLQTCRPALC